MTERTVSATEARVHFGELLDGVTKRNDVVFIERLGARAAVVVSIDEWQRRTEVEDDPWAGVAEGMEEHWAYMDEQVRAGLASSVDVVADLHAAREERDEQLLGDLR